MISIVYMVAGMSSRFGGKIKQFAKIGPAGETLIEYSMNQALSAGFDKIIFIVGNMTEKPFKEMFGTSYKGIPIEYAKQTFDPKERDKPWGTVDALCSIIPLCKGPFVVCNGDDIYGTGAFKLMVEHLKKSEEEATVGYPILSVIPENGSVNRGIFFVEENYVVGAKEIIGLEKKNLDQLGLSGNELCSMNLFALHPKTLKLLEGVLEQFKKKNAGDRKLECYLPTEISRLIGEGKIKMRLYETQDRWFGVTNPEDEQGVRNQIISFEEE